jgi:hypothetical protein
MMEFFFVLFVVIIILILREGYNASIIPSSTPPVYRPKHEDLDDTSLVSPSYTSDDTFYRRIWDETWDDDYIISSSSWSSDFSSSHDDILTDPAYCHIPGNIFYHSCHDDTSTSTSSSFDDWSSSSSSWDDWSSSLSSSSWDDWSSTSSSWED